MLFNKYCIWAAIAISGSISLITVLGWFLDIQIFYQPSPDLPPMSLQAGLITLLITLAFIFKRFERKDIARILSGVLTILIIILFFYSFEDSHSKDFISTTQVAINTLIVLFCLTLSLLILTYDKLTSLHISLSLSFTLLSISISLLAMYGYIVGTEFAYWWPGSRPMALNSACALLALSLGLLAKSWSLLDSDKSKSRHIVYCIQVASGSILFITALLSSALVLIPLYETLLDKEYENARRGIEGKSNELSLFFASIKSVADSIALQYEKINHNDIPVIDSLESKTIKPQLDEDNFSLGGVTPGVKNLRFKLAQKPLGTDPPDTTGSDRLNGARLSLKPGLTLKILENLSEKTSELIVLTDINGSSDGVIGTIEATVDLNYLRQLLTKDIGFSVQEGIFYIVPDTSATSTKLLRISNSTSIVQITDIDANLGELLHALTPDLAGDTPPSRAIMRRDIISFLAPLSGTQAYLGFVSRVSPFRHIFQKKILNVVLGVTSLLLIATGFIFLLMRKLGSQILYLQSNIAESFKTIEHELTLRKDAQREIERSLAEKEILLKEIHHRVKNNLQIITSILNLQLRRSKQSEVSIALRESADRIQSIALLHETLYRSENFSSIDLEPYFKELIGHLVRSYNKDSTLKSTISMCDIRLELDRAIPLGLILTELVTNSLKYAFKDFPLANKQPEITIKCNIEDDGNFIFRYSDNGKGLPEDFSFDALPSLGSRLILTLVKQLNGNIIYKSRNGAYFEVCFLHKSITKEDRHYEKAANSNS